MTGSTTTQSDTLPSQGRKAFHETELTAERVDSLYQRGKEKVRHAEEGLEAYVRAHPVKSLLIASGVGVAVGVLLGRRR